MYADMNKKTMEYMGKLDDTKKSFMHFMHETLKEGALPTKTKELITLALAIKSQCDYCISLHVQKCIEAGAEKNEIMETIWVATLMGGGPALMYGQIALDALEELGE